MARYYGCQELQLTESQINVGNLFAASAVGCVDLNFFQRIMRINLVSFIGLSLRRFAGCWIQMTLRRYEQRASYSTR